MPSSPTLAASDFSRFVQLNARPYLDASEGTRGQARLHLLQGISQLLNQSAEQILSSLPKLIGEAFGEFGWAWNGFYALRSDGCLHLSFAHGPPVCSQLESSGAALTSGMCFDSLALNQTLAAHDTKDWPGYVSCDASSHLGTAAGIVVPMRDATGTPIGCWDLDCIQGIENGDVRFMDVLLSTLARCVAIERRSFGPDF